MSGKQENIVLQNFAATGCGLYGESQESRYQKSSLVSSTTALDNSGTKSGDRVYESMDGLKDANAFTSDSMYPPLPPIPAGRTDYAFVHSNNSRNVAIQKQLRFSKGQVLSAFLGICIFLAVSAIVAGLVLGILNWTRQESIMEQSVQQTKVSSEGDEDLAAQVSKLEAMVQELKVNLTHKNNELTLQLNVTSRALNMLAQQVSSLQPLLDTSIGEVAVTITNLTSRMVAAERNITALHASQASLSQQATTIENNIELTRARTSTLETHVNNLNSTQLSLMSRASNIEDNVVSLSATLTGNISVLHRVNSFLTSRTTNLETNVNSISYALYNNVSVLIQADTVLSTRTDNLDDRVRTLAMEQTSLKSHVSSLTLTHRDDVDTLTLSQSSLMSHTTVNFWRP